MLSWTESGTLFSTLAVLWTEQRLPSARKAKLQEPRLGRQVIWLQNARGAAGVGQPTEIRLMIVP